MTTFGSHLLMRIFHRGGQGQALPTSAGNAGIAVSRGPLVTEHVLHRDCHKNKTESHFSECEYFVTV